MGRYLDALKNNEKVGDDSPKKPKELEKGGFLGLLGSPPPTFEKNNAANDHEEVAENIRHFRWLIHFPDRDPVETTCLPEPTHGEVLAMYPDATAAEPIPERTRINTTPEQEAELRALVASVGVAYGFTHAEQQEALDLALWDVDAALVSYRAMLAEQNIMLDGDDRRRCMDCANLTQSGKCKAWESVGAIRGYAPVQDQPKRCEGYAPGPDDPDKRTGRERMAGTN